MINIICHHNGIDLKGQYIIDNDKRRVTVLMVAPYPGITCSHIEIRRDFDDYIVFNGENIARTELIRIFDAVNLINAHFEEYTNYLMEYDCLCSDKIKLCAEIEKVLDDSLVSVRDENHQMTILSKTDDVSVEELLSKDAVRTKTLIELRDIDRDLRKRCFGENGIEEHNPQTFILSIFNYIRESKSISGKIIKS